MPCEILIRATDNPDSPRYKGDPQTVRDDSFLPERPWGSKEGSPEFVILHVTDASAAQIQGYMDAVVNTFEYEIQAENEGGWRIRISLNPKITELYGIDKGVRNEMRDYLIDNWGAQLFDYDSIGHTYAIMDFPKPLIFIPDGVEVGLPELKADVHDKYVDVVFRRRYRFSEADVDLVLGLGGKVDQTLAQVADKVIDRIA